MITLGYTTLLTLGLIGIAARQCCLIWGSCSGRNQQDAIMLTTQSLNNDTPPPGDCIHVSRSTGAMTTSYSSPEIFIYYDYHPSKY